MDNSESKNNRTIRGGSYLIDYADSLGRLIVVSILWAIFIGTLSYSTYKECVRIVEWREIRDFIADKHLNKLRDVRITKFGTDTYYVTNENGKYVAKSDKYVSIHDIKLNKNFKFNPDKLDVSEKDIGKTIKLKISEEDLVGDDNIQWPFGSDGWETVVILMVLLVYFVTIVFTQDEEGLDGKKRRLDEKYGERSGWKKKFDFYDNIFFNVPFIWSLILCGVSLITVITLWAY